MRCKIHSSLLRIINHLSDQYNIKKLQTYNILNFNLLLTLKKPLKSSILHITTLHSEVVIQFTLCVHAVNIL